MKTKNQKKDLRKELIENLKPAPNTLSDLKKGNKVVNLCGFSSSMRKRSGKIIDLIQEDSTVIIKWDDNLDDTLITKLKYYGKTWGMISE